MTTSAADEGAYYIEDETSFAAPRRQAIAECITAFKNASQRVKGAEARLSAALAGLKAISAFADEVDRLIEGRGFQALPGFKRGRERFEGYHQLTVAPWRGVFLVSRNGDNVAAILFSRGPHALEARLHELSDAYRQDEDKADD